MLVFVIVPFRLHLLHLMPITGHVLNPPNWCNAPQTQHGVYVPLAEYKTMFNWVLDSILVLLFALTNSSEQVYAFHQSSVFRILANPVHLGP